MFSPSSKGSITTPRRHVPGVVNVNRPGSVSQGSQSYGSVSQGSVHDIRLDLLERLSRGDLTKWDGYCDMTEHGFALRDYVEDPEKIDLLFEGITGSSKGIKHNANQELKNVQLVIGSVKRTGASSVEMLDTIIAMAERAKVVACHMENDESPLGKLQLEVDFCQWIESYDGPPGHLPVRYLDIGRLVGLYIRHVNKLCPTTSPSEWGARLGISDDILESFDSTKALTILNALEDTEYASFPPVTKHLQMLKDTRTVTSEFTIGRVYTNKHFPLTDLLAILQVYFGLIPSKSHVGNFMPRRIPSEKAKAASEPWELLPLSLKDRQDAFAAGIIDDLCKNFSLAESGLFAAFENWGSNLDTSKLATSEGRAAIENDYSVYKKKATDDYNQWLKSLPPSYISEPTLNAAFTGIFEKHMETESNEMTKLFATSDPSKKKNKK